MTNKLIRAFALAGLWLPFAAAQTIAVVSPTAAQVVSGFCLPLTATPAAAPSTASVDIIVDGEVQGTLWSAPWSIPCWNTNNRYNGPSHDIWAIARNSLGATIATSPTISFSIANNYLEAPAYINLVSVTPSTPFSSTWSGVVSLTSVFNGTNATNQKTVRIFVDGDYSGYSVLSSTAATTMTAVVNTTMYPDAVHEVCSEYIDTNGTAPTNGGFPFGEDCHRVTFANTSTILLVNSVSVSQSTSTTSVATAATTLTAGHFVLACGSDFGGGTLSVSDTAVNTWTPLTSSTSASYKQQCFYAKNVTGNAANVYTLTISGAVTFVDFIVREYSGVDITTPVDVSPVFTGTSSTPCPCVVTSGTFSTGTANEIAAIYLRPEINNVTFLPGANSALTGKAFSAGASDQAFTTTQTNTTTSIGTQNASGQVYLMSVVAIKAASATPISTPAIATLNPKGWVVAPAGTIQLTPLFANTDGTNGTVTAAMNPVYTWTNSAICTVSATGLVTGVAYGLCTVTITLGNGLTETINGWVSATNVIPYFGTDGLIHSSGGTPVWMSSFFNSTGGTGFQDVNKTTLQVGTAYKNAGYNTIEANPTDSNFWGGTGNNCATFQANLDAYIDNIKNTILIPFNLYFHAPTTPLVTGSNPSQFFVGVRGLGASCSPASWQFLVQRWVATLRLMGFELGDEFDANYSFPGVQPIINAGGPFTGITCDSATPVVCTAAYSNPSTASSGPKKFAIFGATTNSVLNSTIGTPGTTTTLYDFINNTPFPSSFQFNGPAGASGITVTPASDPTIRIEPFAYEWEPANGGGGDYQHYQDFMTISSLVHAGGSVVSAAPRAIAGPSAQCGWGGSCVTAGSPSFSDYAIIYNQPAAFGTSQYVALATLRLSPNNVIPQNRAFINGAGALRAFIGQTQAIQQNYGMNGQTISGMSCVGSLCTWPSPHGIYNVVPYTARVTFSGSGNSYFNTNFFIDNCPTATTCNVSRAATSTATPASTTNGTIVFSNGVTLGPSSPWVCLQGGTGLPILRSSNSSTCAGGGGAPPANVVNSQGNTFQISGANGANAAYWNSNTFMLSQWPSPAPTSSLVVREVPPVSQVSGSMTGQVVADNTNVRGQSRNFYGEIPQGSRIPHAFVIAQGITGGTGTRGYTLGGDNNVLFPASAQFGNGVTSITLTGNGTSGCTVSTVTISGGGGAVKAKATVQVAGGVVTGTTLTNPGSGYTSVPTATFTGTGCNTLPTGTVVLGTTGVKNACLADGSDCIQAGSTMFYDQGADLIRFFNSPTNANLILQRLASAGYLYGPRGPAPDIGFNIESSLRQGANGNLLMTMNFQDGALPYPVDLTACNVPGQKKIRYVLDWHAITITELAAGTLTDTPTWPAGGAAFYLCPNNEAAEYHPPTISVRLADVAGASKVIVQYAYSPYFLTGNPVAGVPNAVDCGAGTCTIPVDQGIGKVYYRLVYISGTGAVLARGDVQTL